MENYRKIIGAIIVLFLSIIFVQNTNAITLTTEVEPTGNSWENMRVDCVYSQNDTTWVTSTGDNNWYWSCNNFPSSGNNYGINGIRTHDTIHVEEGLYYQAFLILRNPNQEPYNFPQIFWNFNESENFTFVTIEELYNDSIAQRLSTTCNGSSCYNTFLYDNYYNKVYMVTLRAKSTGDYKFQLGPQGNMIKSPNSKNYVFGLRKIVEYRVKSDTKEAEEKTEEQSEEGQNNADSADSDNEQATSSLLDIAGNIIGALTSSSTGTCTFDADLGNVDFGELNLCSGKPPEFANIIDIVIMLMLIPLIFMTVVSLVHQFINLTKFAQGGD